MSIYRQPTENAGWKPTFWQSIFTVTPAIAQSILNNVTSWDAIPVSATPSAPSPLRFFAIFPLFPPIMCVTYFAFAIARHLGNTPPPWQYTNKYHILYSPPTGDGDGDGGNRPKNGIMLSPSHANSIASAFVVMKTERPPSLPHYLFTLKMDNTVYSKLIRINTTPHLPLNYVKSSVHIMTVEYSHPTLSPSPILIDLSHTQFVSGSEILDAVFIYRYLRGLYGNWVDRVFQLDYTLRIMDEEFRIFELSANQFIRLTETGYDIIMDINHI
jgi:hypothetical protein